MARRTDPQVFVATESGSAEVDGEVITFVKGVTRLRKGHAILSQLPNFFEAADEHLAYDLEDASAAPGEKRGAPEQPALVKNAPDQVAPAA